jgi:hypothetical protein
VHCRLGSRGPAQAVDDADHLGADVVALKVTPTASEAIEVFLVRGLVVGLRWLPTLPDPSKVTLCVARFQPAAVRLPPVTARLGTMVSLTVTRASLSDTQADESRQSEGAQLTLAVSSSFVAPALNVRVTAE